MKDLINKLLKRRPVVVKTAFGEPEKVYLKATYFIGYSDLKKAIYTN